MKTEISKLKSSDNSSLEEQAAPIHLTLPINTANKSKPLHETILNNFNKTQSGKIYEKDIKDIYSMMLICLDLTDHSKSRFHILHKYYPFCFSCETALQVMQKLDVSIELSTTTTTISYSIKPELGLVLLKKFYAAKLLHSPADRTRNEPKHNVQLQPTPKGVCILQDFCKKIGMKRTKYPLILDTNFNSIDLFKFDRDQVTDKIIYSEYFLHLLFIKLFGEKPNVWSPKNLPDPLPSRDEAADSDTGFDFNFNASKYNGFASIVAPVPTVQNDSKAPSTVEDPGVSPFFHIFFANPDSDAHVQYYVSSVGVRLVKDKIFRSETGKDVSIPYVVSGKAICQWLCDCTDVMSLKHAKEIASLILKAKLIKALVWPPSKSDISKFHADRECYYTLTNFGEEVCHWNNPSKKIHNLHSPNLSNQISKLGLELSWNTSLESSNVKDSKMSLEVILNDPGMRYLFKKHLEKEFCSENLDAYLQLKLYDRQLGCLRKLLEANKGSNSHSISLKLIKIANVTLSLAYHIYFTYLSSEAPFVLNIDYNLRVKITSVLIKPDAALSPIDAYRDYLKTPTTTTFGRESSPKLIQELAPAPVILEVEETEKAKDIAFETWESDSSSDKITSQNIYYDPTNRNSTSSDVDMELTLTSLQKISTIFHEISKHIYRLMEVDSLPKFLSSSMYTDTFINP
ncbi:hypothetical protein DFJ63DRAFT_250085 [Scheffersomyces coipomensis]|uniref:uncharacterized protein n=1 Tax=Scheffersomyces coipomensis TaxID=1788519 RepID=UPI00315CDBDB